MIDIVHSPLLQFIVQYFSNTCNINKSIYIARRSTSLKLQQSNIELFVSDMHDKFTATELSFPMQIRRNNCYLEGIIKVGPYKII